MANTPISGFPSGAPAQAADEFVIARSGSNFKLTSSDIRTFARGSLDTVAAGKVLGRDTASGTGPVQELPIAVDASGNVGIGTSAPLLNKLVVQAALSQITATDGAVSQAVGYANINLAYSGTFSNHGYSLITNNTERMRIDAAGNVGIGTSSPLARFEVSAPSTTADMRMSIAGLTYGSMYVTTGNYVILSVSPIPLILGTDNTERMRITATGNVGIGTGTPSASAALEVASATGGVLFPRMTTTQRDAIGSPANGLVLYNITTNKLQVRAAGAWVDLH